MHGKRGEIRPQVERLHLRAIVRCGVPLIRGERPVHAELVLEVVERAEGLVDALTLIAQTLRGILDGRGSDGVIVAAVETALRVARGTALAGERAIGVSHPAPCEIDPPMAVTLDALACAAPEHHAIVGEFLVAA